MICSNARAERSDSAELLAAVFKNIFIVTFQCKTRAPPVCSVKKSLSTNGMYIEQKNVVSAVVVDDVSLTNCHVF